MSEHTPKLEQCLEETVEGSGKSQLVLHSKKPAMNTEGLPVETGLLASSHLSQSTSPSASSDHAPKIEGQDKRRDKESADLELGTKTVSKELMATVDTPTIECSSDTGKTGHSTRTSEDSSSGTCKTGHSTRTKRKHKRKRQHGELRFIVASLFLFLVY